MHGGGEAVGRGVAGLDGFFLGLELRDGANWAEDFFLHNLHVFGHAAEDGGLNVEAFFAFAVAASFDFGTSLLAGVDITRARRWLMTHAWI